MKLLLPLLCMFAATIAAAAPQFTGTFEDRGNFAVIRLNNGELLDVAAVKQQPGDQVYGMIAINGVPYTIFSREAAGPIYAVPGDAS